MPPVVQFLIKNDDLPLAEASCVLPISLLQHPESQEGEAFEETCRLAAKTFGKIYISVADTHQWRTLKVGGDQRSEQELKDNLRSEGKAWVTRNRAAIDLLGDKLEKVTFWDEELDQAQNQINTVHNDYYGEPGKRKVFIEVVNSFSNKFLERKLNSGNRKNYGVLSDEMQHVIKYILVESGVILSWKNKYNVILYPGKMPEPIFNMLQYHNKNNKNFLKMGTISIKENRKVFSSEQSIFYNSFRELPENNTRQPGMPILGASQELDPAVQQILLGLETAFNAQLELMLSFSAKLLDPHLQIIYQQQILNAVTSKIGNQMKKENSEQKYQKKMTIKQSPPKECDDQFFSQVPSS